MKVNATVQTYKSIYPLVDGKGSLCFIWDKVKGVADAIFSILAFIPLLLKSCLSDRKIEPMQKNSPSVLSPTIRKTPSPHSLDSPRSEEELNEEMFAELEAKLDAYIEKARNLVKTKGSINWQTRDAMNGHLGSQVGAILKKYHKAENLLAGIEHPLFQAIMDERLEHHLRQASKDQYKEILLAYGYEEADIPSILSQYVG